MTCSWAQAGACPAHCLGSFLQSKGGILSKACDYIQELRQSNHRLSEELQGLDQLQLDNDVLRQQVRVRSAVQPPASAQPWPCGTPRPALKLSCE